MTLIRLTQRQTIANALYAKTIVHLFNALTKTVKWFILTPEMPGSSNPFNFKMPIKKN